MRPFSVTQQLICRTDRGWRERRPRRTVGGGERCGAGCAAIWLSSCFFAPVAGGGSCIGTAVAAFHAAVVIQTRLRVCLNGVTRTKNDVVFHLGLGNGTSYGTNAPF